MTEEVRTLLYAAVKAVGTAAVVGCGAGFMLLDVLVLKNGIRETSFTEIGQEIFLFITAALFLIRARQPGYLGFGALVGGFFGCMFIRELDGPLDRIVQGFWMYPAWILAIGCLYVGWKDRAAAVARLAEFARSQPFGIMIAGLSTILVFSRLIGVPELWQAILTEGYIKTAKHAAEEGTETLGYSLCLVATLEYLWVTRSQLLQTFRPASA